MKVLSQISTATQNKIIKDYDKFWKGTARPLNDEVDYRIPIHTSPTLDQFYRLEKRVSKLERKLKKLKKEKE